MKTKQITIVAIAVLLMVFWGYSILIDLSGRMPLHSQVKDSTLFGDSLPFFSIIELLIILIILWNKTRKIGLLASFLLLTTLTVYVFYNLAYPEKPVCSCAKDLPSPWKANAILNSVLICINAIGLMLLSKQAWVNKTPTNLPVQPET